VRLVGRVLDDELRVEEEVDRLADRLLSQLTVSSRIGGAMRCAEPLERREDRAGLLDEVLLHDAAVPIRQQRRRHERRGRSDRDPVDLVRDLVRDTLHERAALRRRDGTVRLAGVRVHAGDFLHDVVEFQHIAELDVEAAVARAQDLRGVEQAADVLLRLLAAADLVHVERSSMMRS